MVTSRVVPLDTARSRRAWQRRGSKPEVPPLTRRRETRPLGPSCAPAAHAQPIRSRDLRRRRNLRGRPFVKVRARSCASECTHLQVRRLLIETSQHGLRLVAVAVGARSAARDRRSAVGAPARRRGGGGRRAAAFVLAPLKAEAPRSRRRAPRCRGRGAGRRSAPLAVVVARTAAVALAVVAAPCRRDSRPPAVAVVLAPLTAEVPLAVVTRPPGPRCG